MVHYSIIILTPLGDTQIRSSENLLIVPGSSRSSLLIGGAWMGFYHWSEQEGKLWNEALHRFTSEDWRYSRPMHEIQDELQRFPTFEKVISYQVPGLINSPDARHQPGGIATVQLNKDYLQYYQTKKINPN